MNIGKLYQVKKLYWLFFPSKDIVAPPSAGAAGASDDAAYYSMLYKCNVSYISPNSIFLLLEQDKRCCKILTTNGELGWIYLYDWYKDDIEEVTV